MKFFSREMILQTLTMQARRQGNLQGKKALLRRVKSLISLNIFAY
jgi:hypothetical protein